MNKLLRISSIVLALVLVLGAFTGCGSKETAPGATPVESSATAEKTEQQQEVLEYTFLDLVNTTAPYGYNNPNDVVTPEVEKKFNIKVKEVTFAAGTKPLEQINMMVAANNVPDVVLVDNPNLPIFYSKGVFAELDEYIPSMKNTDKWISDTGWNMLKVNGKIVALPTEADVDTSNPEVAEIVNNDPFYRPMNNHCIKVREDVLTKLGYTFKPMKQIQEELDANPRQITEDDVKLEPAINTVEDFEKLLYGIRDLNLKVGDKSVIPLTIPDWGGYHLSVLFAPTGGWYCDKDTMEVTGFITNPMMKEYYQTLRKWYNDGILDNDYLIQKPEQLQEKVASGRVASLFFTPDINAARANLKQISPDMEFRSIPWPQSMSGEPGYIDASYPSGFYNLMINKEFKDIGRLIEYFDWFQTEEAMELTTWGPESAGLYVEENGVKKFKDNALWEAIRDGSKTADGKNAEYYGLYDNKNPTTIYTSKAFLCAPAPFFNYKGYERSYPAKFDAFSDTWNYIAAKKLCRDGTVLSSCGEKSNVTSGYYWSTVSTGGVAKMLSAKTDEEFDKIWEETVNDYMAKGEYEAGKAEMLEQFKNVLGK